MKKKERILYKKIAIVVLVILLVILARGVSNGYLAVQDAKEIQQDKQQEFDKLDQRIVYLENRIDFLDSKEGLEQELLETFPIKRQGEQVTILIEQEDRSAGFLIESEDIPWWKFWKK